MPSYPWRDFLIEWSGEIVASRQYTEFLTHLGDQYPGSYAPDVMSSRWLGYLGASEEQIAPAEARLGVALPPDYREFLQVSNGWRWVNNFIPCIWPVEDIQWLHDSDPDIIRDWNAGWGAPEENAPEIHEQKYLSSTLRISDIEYAGTAMLLLNPQLVSPAGEWEAWFFAHWVPGANTYPSFWELMQEMHQSFLRLE